MMDGGNLKHAAKTLQRVARAKTLLLSSLTKCTNVWFRPHFVRWKKEQKRYRKKERTRKRKGGKKGGKKRRQPV